MTLLDYHRLRAEEKNSWNEPQLEAAARLVDPQLPEHIAGLFPRDEERTGENLIDLHQRELDERFQRLCELYRDSPVEVRTYMRSRVTRRMGSMLSGFALRSAVLGLRKNEPGQIRLGLLGFVLDDLGGDARDTLIAVTLSYHLLARCGVDASAAFREAAAMAGPAARALLLDYATAPRSLGAMGWKEFETPAGPGFRGW